MSSITEGGGRKDARTREVKLVIFHHVMSLWPSQRKGMSSLHEGRSQARFARHARAEGADGRAAHLLLRSS